MNLDNFLLTPEETTNLVNDLIPQPQAGCTPVVCVGVLAVALHVVVVWSYAVAITAAVALQVYCVVIGPCR